MVVGGTGSRREVVVGAVRGRKGVVGRVEEIGGGSAWVERSSLFRAVSHDINPVTFKWNASWRTRSRLACGREGSRAGGRTGGRAGRRAGGQAAGRAVT